MFGTKGITDVLLLLRSYTDICKAHPPIETHKGIKGGVSCFLKGRKRYGTDLPETVALLVDVASSSVFNSISTFDAGVLDHAIAISLKQLFNISYSLC
jgi:hypothetical protein